MNVKNCDYQNSVTKFTEYYSAIRHRIFLARYLIWNCFFHHYLFYEKDTILSS